MVGTVDTLFRSRGLPLSIRKHNNKGRYVIAERDVKKGELVMDCAPYAVVVDEKNVQYL
jgi:hypothetical protein